MGIYLQYKKQNNFSIGINKREQLNNTPFKTIIKELVPHDRSRENSYETLRKKTERKGRRDDLSIMRKKGKGKKGGEVWVARVKLLKKRQKRRQRYKKSQ